MSVIALLSAFFIAVIGGVAAPAVAHDCGCQTDNSGPGSANSGPGNACHDHSGPGSTTSGSSGSNSGSSGSNSGSNSGPGPNSGPGNGDECPPTDPGDDPGDGNDTGDDNGTGTMGGQTTTSNPVVRNVQASVQSTSPTRSAAQVPTAVNAGLTDGPEAPSALPVVMMLIGLATMLVALGRRRARG
jgi:hypothetical protein